MRYVYYIIAIVVVFTGLAVYGVFDAGVEVSKPSISVNDRIISRDEFSRLLKGRPAGMTREQFAESVIDNQLLIQEAIKLKINQEESFRQSVESFYEKSMIKILLDRKRKSLVVDVTDEELEKYENLLSQKVVITKMRYQNLDDAGSNSNGIHESIEAEFEDLPDDVKFIILNLKKDKLSPPRPTALGYVVYRLDKTVEKEKTDPESAFDIKKVSIYLQDKKKEEKLEEWMRSIRDKADIWREK